MIQGIRKILKCIRILCGSDGYGVGDHTVLIYAKSIDGKIGQYETVFTVYSNSTTLITIYGLEGCEFMSTGNFLKLSISSSYPDYYTLWIDGVLVFSDNYTSGEMKTYSLDDYTAIIGNYSMYIWAIGLDGKVVYINAEFSVYSTSSTIISINILDDAKFLSYNNTMIFTIYSDYPDYYELWIDGALVQREAYDNGVPIIFSLDNYTDGIGTHPIFIWAVGLDGKIGTIGSEFRIYSSSSTIINITFLGDYELNSTGNSINFISFLITPITSAFQSTTLYYIQVAM